VPDFGHQPPCANLFSRVVLSGELQPQVGGWYFRGAPDEPGRESAATDEKGRSTHEFGKRGRHFHTWVRLHKFSAAPI
jgi:hypothetical protein